MSEEGRKIFIHNVSEESQYEDFQESVEKFGEVTDFFNPGRGFAFITFSSNEEAQACIAALDNTDVAGRTIQMNIAKPKGDRGGDRGGRGGPRGEGFVQTDEQIRATLNKRQRVMSLREQAEVEAEEAK